MFYEMLQVGFMKAFTIIKSFGTLGVKGLTAATQPKQIKHQIKSQTSYKTWQKLNFTSSSLQRVEYISTTPQFALSQIP